MVYLLPRREHHPFLIYVLTFISLCCMLVANKRAESQGDEMENQQQDNDGAHIGDKVRLRSGTRAKERGIIQATEGDSLEIQLDDGALINARSEEITNYSLAARRAWQAMPKQAGRPQLAVPRKRMASLRLDIDILDDLDRATESGLIPNKEQAVNTWLRQQLDALFKEGPCSDKKQE